MSDVESEVGEVLRSLVEDVERICEDRPTETSTMEEGSVETSQEDRDRVDFPYDAATDAHDCFAVSEEFKTTPLGEIANENELAMDLFVDCVHKVEQRAGSDWTERCRIEIVCRCARLWDEQRGSVHFGEFRAFLGKFGPCANAFSRFERNILTGEGLIHDGFWCDILNRREAATMLKNRPGKFLIRYNLQDESKLVISYASHHENVRHCGLKNNGSLGYTARVNFENETFKALPDFLQACKQQLKEPFPSKWARDLNREFVKELRVPAGVLELESLGDDDDLLNAYYFSLNENGQRMCNRDCEQALPFSNWLHVSCEICNIKNRCKHDFPKEGDNLEVKSEKKDASFTNPEFLDFELRKGADKFRNGKRGEAQEIFEKVLRLAAKNVDFHIEYQATPEPERRPPAFVVLQSVLNHNENASWCKCVGCSSLRASARAYGNLGHINMDRKNISRAVDLYGESLPILREMGMWKQEPIVLHSLTQCAILLGDANLGSSHGVEYVGTITHENERKNQIMKIQEISVAKSMEFLSAEEIIQCLIEGDEVEHKEEALKFYFKALTNARWTLNEILEVNALLRMGCCLFMMHRLRSAIMFLERAVLLLRNNKNAGDKEMNEEATRVQLHNFALKFAKQATARADWTKPTSPRKSS